MARDLFRKSFDEGTLIKLKIFEDYFKEWLPVFLKKTYWKEIQIFDLFAGEGKDSQGADGSPIRVVNTLNENSLLIEESKVKIKFIVNELEKEKYDLLTLNLKSYMQNSRYSIECYNQEFKTVFFQFYDSMKETANFLFLD